MNPEDKAQVKNPKVSILVEKDESNLIEESLKKLKHIKETELQILGNEKLNKKALASICIIALVLLVPIPKNVGGDIEIEGTPASQQAFLRPSVQGTVKEVLVSMGEKVKANQTLVKLQNWDLDEKILTAQKEKAYLQATIPSLKQQVNVGRSEYKRALENYNKNQSQSKYLSSQAEQLKTGLPPKLAATKSELEKLELQKESLINKAAMNKYLAEKQVYPAQMAVQSEYEAAAAAKEAESLKSQLSAQKQDLQENNKVEGFEATEAFKATQANLFRTKMAESDINSAKSQIEGLDNLLATYQEQKESLNLKSPINGVVLTLKTDLLIGQNFNKGDSVIAVGDLDNVRTKLLLPEQEIAFVKTGQKVVVRLIGVPDRVFEGKVDQIAPVTSEITEQIKKKRIFEITVLLPNEKDLIKPGMTGYASIDTKVWRSILLQSWDEIYRVFRLDRFINHNPIHFTSNGK